MSDVALWLSLSVGVALSGWAWIRSSKRFQAAHAPARATDEPAPAQQHASAPVLTPPALACLLPRELQALVWRRESDVDPAKLDALLAAIKGIPRPPKSLQRLLSPDFAARAGAAELSELVMAEPLIAAKVLAAVNAPAYGLQRPVAGVAQAVSLLGMTTVRSVCLRYMLGAAFKPRLAASQRVFDTIWCASAIASEMRSHLNKALKLPDPGGAATQVMLGFVGQLAAASLMPTEQLENWLALDRVARTEKEQALMHLNAIEIGGLLLGAWALPQDLISDVCDSGRLLITAAPHTAPERAPRLALNYLCAGLGERLAQGQLTQLSDHNPTQDLGADTHHLRSLLGLPALSGLTVALQAPALQRALEPMLKHLPTAVAEKSAENLWRRPTRDAPLQH
jgi:HD-like signal output (HDOD) protein